MIKHELRKITHYEYWPFWIFYLPAVPLWFFNSLRNKSFIYFTAVNPKIKFGGFFNYDKFKLQEKISLEYRPEHYLLKKDLKRKLKNLPFEYPFIAKPNLGERGKNVQLVVNPHEWNAYLNKVDKDILLQEYIDKKHEFGLFYVKKPNQSKGEVISITGKNFLTFNGNSETSLREFIESNERAYFNKSYLYMKFHEKQDLVLDENESILLEEIGNHNRGTYFYDASDLLTPKLSETVDNILSEIEDFHYGRLDVRANSIEDLKNGKFKILEINGANSEPSHIYDKKINIFKAYKEVYKYLNIQAKIARNNIKKGAKLPKFRSFMGELYRYLIQQSATD